MAEGIKTIAEFCDYLIHPTKILIAFWNFVVDVSYPLCLFICLGALLLYIFGVKKYSKWIPASIGIFALIQAIGSVVK